MKKLLALSLSAAMLVTPTVSFAQEKNVSSSITEQQNENEGDIYTESIEYNIDTNRQNIQSLSVPTDVSKEIESGATLTSYSENKKFVVLQGDKYHFVTKTEAEEMKKKNGVKSLSELVDEKKAIDTLATLNKEGVSPSPSDEANFSTSSVYDRDSVTMWDH